MCGSGLEFVVRFSGSCETSVSPSRNAAKWCLACAGFAHPLDHLVFCFLMMG